MSLLLKEVPNGSVYCTWKCNQQWKYLLCLTLMAERHPPNLYQFVNLINKKNILLEVSGLIFPKRKVKSICNLPEIIRWLQREICILWRPITFFFFLHFSVYILHSKIYCEESLLILETFVCANHIKLWNVHR